MKKREECFFFSEDDFSQTCFVETGFISDYKSRERHLYGSKNFELELWDGVGCCLALIDKARAQDKAWENLFGREKMFVYYESMKRKLI